MPNLLRNSFARWALVACAFTGVLPLIEAVPAFAQARVIEVLADRDSRYKVGGQSNPQMTLKAGEQVLLRINARKAKTQTRDGSVHGFTVVRARDLSRVQGWDLMLKPGLQEFTLTAPAEAGEYWVLCTVLCSDEHEEMKMKLIVVS